MAIKKQSAPGGSKRQTLVRGADGGLYLLTDADLASHKLSDAEANAVTEILKDADENPRAEKLPSQVIKDIRNEGSGLDQSADTYINNVPNK